MPTAENFEEEPKSLVLSETAMLREIIDTEDNYVECLRSIVEDYMPLFTSPDPGKVKIMKKLKSLIFSAIEDVYIYHTNIIYPGIIGLNKKNEETPVEKFAEAIASRKDAFDPYAFYVQGRPASKMLLAYNLGQHKNLKLIDAALQSGDKTRTDLENILQEPIIRIKKYAKLLARIISKTPLDDPEIDTLSDAFGAVDLEDEYENAVTAWAAERIKECPLNLREQGELIRYSNVHYSKDGGEVTRCCLFFYSNTLIITTPELYDLPPEEHSKELTFLHYIPLSGCEVRTGIGSEDKFDIKILKSDGFEETFSFWTGSKKNRIKWMKRLATLTKSTVITFTPLKTENVSIRIPPGSCNESVEKAIVNLSDGAASIYPNDMGKQIYKQAEKPAAAEVTVQGEGEAITPVVVEPSVSKPKPERKGAKPSLFTFWHDKEAKAKETKLSAESSKTPLQFKYGKETGEEEKKARAFKLKESNRFKFWKLKEQEVKKAQKNILKPKEENRRAQNIYKTELNDREPYTPGSDEEE